jgi:hypothetical protein
MMLPSRAEWIVSTGECVAGKVIPPLHALNGRVFALRWRKEAWASPHRDQAPTPLEMGQSTAAFRLCLRVQLLNDGRGKSYLQFLAYTLEGGTPRSQATMERTPCAPGVVGSGRARMPRRGVACARRRTRLQVASQLSPHTWKEPRSRRTAG